MKGNSPPPNYDYTSAKRGAARRARAAMILSPITLDAQHAAALRWILGETDETTAACIRRLILAEAERRCAPIDPSSPG